VPWQHQNIELGLIQNNRTDPDLIMLSATLIFKPMFSSPSDKKLRLYRIALKKLFTTLVFIESWRTTLRECWRDKVWCRRIKKGWELRKGTIAPNGDKRTIFHFYNKARRVFFLFTKKREELKKLRVCVRWFKHACECECMYVCELVCVSLCVWVSLCECIFVSVCV